MTIALDTMISEAVYLAKTLEKAVHDQGNWTMTWGQRTVPAWRTQTETGVLFTAEFTEHCFLRTPDARLTLDCDGEVVSVQAIVFPGDGAFEVHWALAISPAVALVS